MGSPWRAGLVFLPALDPLGSLYLGLAGFFFVGLMFARRAAILNLGLGERKALLGAMRVQPGGRGIYEGAPPRQDTCNPPFP